MQVTLTIDKRDLERVRRAAPEALKRFVYQTGLQVEREAVLIVGQRAEKFGHLGRSIGMRMAGSAKWPAAELYATAKYARYVHEGTGIYGPMKRPFFVKAKNKKALHFVWRGAEWVRRSVTIKGMRGRPFFIWAVERVVPERMMGIWRRIEMEVFKGK